MSQLTKCVYGYLPYWVSVDPTTLRWDLFFDVIYFDATVSSSTGAVTGNNGWATSGATTNALVTAAHANGAKAHLCATTSTPDTLVGNATSRGAAIQQLVDLVAQVGADGLNIDFEFVTSAHAADFTTFIQ